MHKFKKKLIRTPNDLFVPYAIKNNRITVCRNCSLKDVIFKNTNITLTTIFIGRRKVKLFIFTSGLMITRGQYGLNIKLQWTPTGLNNNGKIRKETSK
jgi:hypothetical protein